MKNFLKFFAVLLVALMFVLGCSSSQEVVNDKVQEEKPEDSGQANKDNASKENETEDKDNTNETSNEENEDANQVQDPKEAIDLTLKPNEAGEVMVLMYHNIGEEEQEWVRTVENFKKDLEILYEKGYRAISLKDYVNNNIDVEAGYTPVVITFDDGNQNNFDIIEKDGEKIITPNSAVGIMEEFKKEHPDFNLTATFFINGTRPFRQDELIEYKLNFLIQNGYDVGNHTYGHDNMADAANQDPIKIQKSISLEADFLEGYIPDYEVNTYALSYGGRPKNEELVPFLQKGEYEGKAYNNIAILNVGWNPSSSPVDKKFNPYSIPRIRASETKVDGVGMYDWMSVFEKHPDRRYISDGNSDIITVPDKYEEKVDKARLNDKELYVYVIKE